MLGFYSKKDSQVAIEDILFVNDLNRYNITIYHIKITQLSENSNFFHFVFCSLIIMWLIDLFIQKNGRHNNTINVNILISHNSKIQRLKCPRLQKL